MAKVRETKGLGERTISHNPQVHEIVPTAGWTEDYHAHYLLLSLPEFKTKEVNLEVDSSGQFLTVSGERMETAGAGDKFKIFMFKQTFKLPQNIDIFLISGKVEDDYILRITVPKRPPEEDQHVNNHITKEDYGQETTSDYVDNKYGDGTKEDYGQETSSDYVENERGDGGRGSADHVMEKKSPKNSQMDIFPREVNVIVVLAVLALLLAIVYCVFGSAGHDGAV